jgi:hypothetical protein
MTKRFHERKPHKFFNVMVATGQDTFNEVVQAGCMTSALKIVLERYRLNGVERIFVFEK